MNHRWNSSHLKHSNIHFHLIFETIYIPFTDKANNNQMPTVTPIQGPIYLKNGTVPVVPLFSYPKLNNGSFLQIPVSVERRKDTLGGTRFWARAHFNWHTEKKLLFTIGNRASEINSIYKFNCTKLELELMQYK